MLAFSCNHMSKTMSVEELVTDSLRLPISELKIYKGINYISSNDNECLVSFFDRYSYSIYTYDIKKNSFQDTIPLKKYTRENSRDAFVDYFFENKDTVFILLNTNFIFEISENHKKIYDLGPLLCREIDSFAFTGADLSKFQKFGDTISVELYTHKNRTVWDGPNKEYLTRAFSVGIELKDDPELIYKYNPNDETLLVQDFRTFRRRVSISGNEIFYSYAHSNKLLHTRFFPIETDTLSVKTNFFYENIPYDYNNIHDFGYMTSYEGNQSRFGYLFYDSFREKIILFLKHKGQYIEKDGTKNEYYDFPFSMFIIDKDSKEQIEIYIPPKVLGEHYLSFITPDGFYIPAHNSQQNDENSTLFYKISITD